MDHHRSGLVTSESRSVWGLIGATFRHYGNDFVSLMAASVFVQVPYFVLELLFDHQSTATAQLDLAKLKHVTSLAQLTKLEQQSGASPQPVTWVLLFLNLLVVIPLLYGIVVQLVLHEHQRDFRGVRRVPVMFSHAFHRLAAAIGSLVLASLLVVFASLAGMAVIGLFVAVLAAVGMSTSVVAGVVVLLSLVLLCVLIWVGVKIVAVIPVVYAEDTAGVSAVARSVRLAQKSAWHIIGFVFCIYVISAVARVVVSSIVYSVVQNATGGAIGTDILTLFTEPFILVGMTLLYVNLRARSERSGARDHRPL